MPTDPVLAPVLAGGERALDELAAKLERVPNDALLRPHTDPHGAAVAAILVSDWLLQPDFSERLPPAGLDEARARELGVIARAIAGLVAKLDGNYLPEAEGLADEIVRAGSDLRDEALPEIERALRGDAEIESWLEAVRLGAGPVDLVYDLRALADIRSRHAGKLDGATPPAKLRAAADAIEQELRAGEPPERADARTTIARLWTMFVPAYDRATAAGRSISRAEGAERSFPPLALIAAHRRAKRKPISLVPPEKRSGKTPAFQLPEVAKPDAESTATPPPSSVDEERPSWTESRRSRRAVLELEVGIGTESNFYVGFTENLSVAGVFVATYRMRAIGSRVNVALTMADGEMVLPGKVRWQRDATADGWPGLGVEFEALSPEQEARIQKFLSLREPLFYDD